MNETHRIRVTFFIPTDTAIHELDKSYVTQQAVSIDVDTRQGFETLNMCKYTFAKATDTMGPDNRVHTITQVYEAQLITKFPSSVLKSVIGSEYNEVFDKFLNASTLWEKSRESRKALNLVELGKSPDSPNLIEYDPIKVTG